jgi:hypothetical protein
MKRTWQKDDHNTEKRRNDALAEAEREAQAKRVQANLDSWEYWERLTKGWTGGKP